MEEAKALFQRARGGDEAARGELIEKNLGLVRHVAKRFAGRGVEGEDLFQIGVMGLIKALDRFDPEFGVQFSTYAVPMIMGEIRRFLRDDGPLRISRSIRENAAKLERIREDYQKRVGREPRLSELSCEAGIGLEDVVLALEASEGVASLEEASPYEDGESVPLLERLSGEAGSSGNATQAGNRDPEKERLLDRMLTTQLMEGLETEERKLIWLRFFRDMTQAETATHLGISQVQVGRREKKILEKMRQRIS